MVIWKPILIVLGLVTVLNVKWCTEVGFTVIKPLVADWTEFVAVRVRVPAVFNEKPSKVCVP